MYSVNISKNIYNKVISRTINQIISNHTVISQSFWNIDIQYIFLTSILKYQSIMYVGLQYLYVNYFSLFEKNAC